MIDPLHARPPARAAASDPVREAAADLHRQFVSEMLKQARLAEALGAGGEDAGLGGALASAALDKIAGNVAASQPGLTEALYQALRRGAEGG